MDNFNQLGNTSNYLEVFSFLQKENSAKSYSLNYRVVHIGAAKNIIAIAMRKKVEFESFQADKEIIVKVITGKILLRHNNQRNFIEIGSTYTLSSKEYYLIEAIEDTCFLLTTIV